ncbi:ABC transporter substrate-binding protein [Pseudonocardia phyllosphaerae]|uniref:ABC transporter substrate-binding protein n=1 Tax=Pseudonocardia phyllosphaerae TaxID=3390502 RepID=UPI00397CF0AC
MNLRLSLIALVPVVSALVVACGSPAPASAPPDGAAAEAGYPVHYRSCGHDFTAPEPPKRVLLGSASTLPTLAALGVQDRAFGYLTGQQYPPPPESRNLQEVSPDFMASRETVLGARPDLVLTTDENQVSGEQGTPSADDLTTLGAGDYVMGGFCVGAAAPTGVDVVYDDIRQLGAIFGVPERAARLEGELKQRMAAAGAVRGSRPPARVAFVQVYDGKLYALSGGPYAAILAGAGMTNEFADVKDNFAEITSEQILVRRPDAVLVVHGGTEDPQQTTEAVGRMMAGSPAVQRGAVYPVSGSEITGGGVNIVSLIESVAKKVYGG